MKNLIRPAITLFILISLVTGLLYPLAVTGIAQIAFPEQAAGSLLKRGDEIIGSTLIGQSFSGSTYFWSRPSATSPMPYNASNSGGSNLGPTNPALIEAVNERIKNLRANHPEKEEKIPTDLVTASASGLDSHISPAAAYYQIERVAAARNTDTAIVKSLVDRSIETPQWGLLGDSRVNVLRLNLALDALEK
ncbi:potassium-transporting ATPase subunit KdpC [Nitrosomonas oligotropha]|uniref:Potassium-transporting ATPase KdpC subunit n=1 Tax=Nitrosomonas oligotropha TaxID=42354 RepID=A0A1H8TKX4_9PROT|nr:potassium-transporting ATPase subunit KdpC [Nitrosomonas oligotropha]SDX32097.1 K+-transporting ATPase ATPase C chain [Nitrosomonas oligotropha]SEO91224.1 K+-transporting ATPase ATPase C chain [Nitrosomonas oligotropha]